MLSRGAQDNVQILRDLGTLQVHTRDVDGFVATRHQLLTLKPALHANWVGYAFALHLDGQHARALDVLAKADELMADECTKIERSELLMFAADVLFQTADYAVRAPSGRGATY